MSATAPAPLKNETDRTAVNRENSQHSTGPRTDAGKLRSSLNALRHGLTARSAVLPTEDQAAYELHCQQFRDEYKPVTPTETQLVHELADTAWRLNRIPLLEAGLFKETLGYPPLRVIQALSTLGLYGARLSRQFHKTLEQLRTIQRERVAREPKPGFVFSASPNPTPEPHKAAPSVSAGTVNLGPHDPPRAVVT